MPAKPPIFHTLGCRLNAYETEAMKALSDQAGVDNAVVVNTCAVTAEAVRKARQEIRKLRRENAEAKIIVTGCAAQTETETFRAMDEVDQVSGNTEKMKPETWAGIAGDFIGRLDQVVGDRMTFDQGQFICSADSNWLFGVGACTSITSVDDSRPFVLSRFHFNSV